MRFFTINKIVNVIGAILFVIMAIFLIIGFALNLSIVDELQQASNFDNWKYFILLSGIVAIITAIVFGFGAWCVRFCQPIDTEVASLMDLPIEIVEDIMMLCEVEDVISLASTSEDLARVAGQERI